MDRPRRCEHSGEFVRLAPLHAERDVSELYACSHGSPERTALWTYMPYGPFAGVDDMRRFLAEKEASTDPLFFTVQDLRDGGASPVGMVSFLNIVPDHRRLELGHIWYGPRAQRTKVNTESVYLMLREAFDHLGRRRVEWKCDALNERSRASPPAPSPEERGGMQVIMPQERSLTHLIRRARGGDREAFDELVVESRGRLESLVRGRLRPELRQQLSTTDLAHETFARAFESLPRFEGDDDDAWFAWLSGIARNVVLKAVGTIRERPSLRLEREPIGDAPSPGHAIRREERFERLQDALGSLPDDYRRVIQLCRIDGFSIREAAARLDRSPDATKKLLWRALKELKRQFGNTESLGLPERPREAEGGGRDAP